MSRPIPEGDDVMHGQHSSTPWGHGFPPLADLMDRLSGMASPGGPRARRGDIRTAILRLLSEQPMHGYQVIHELAERSGGMWRPSAGSVYPTLQLLSDEGLLDSEQVAGKKVYHLTDAGRAAVAEAEGKPSPWEDAAPSGPDAGGFHQAVARLMPAIFQVGRTGSAAQRAAASAVLDEARKKLYTILAGD